MLRSNSPPAILLSRLFLAGTFVPARAARADDPLLIVPGGWRTFTTVNAPIQDATRDGRALGHGKGYLYPHEFEGHFTPQNYLPDAIKGMSFYAPGDQGYET